jgi:hypothetical protein
MAILATQRANVNNKYTIVVPKGYNNEYDLYVILFKL